MSMDYLYRFCTHLALKAVFVVEEKGDSQTRPFPFTYYHHLIYHRLTEAQHQWCRHQLQQELTPPHHEGIWQDQKTGIFHRNIQPLPPLAPLDAAILSHMLQHPQQRQTYTQIIHAAWPEAECGGVSTECVYQAVRRIRQQIEPVPNHPQYLLNWRGRPEGGYLLFPTGSSPHQLL